MKRSGGMPRAQATIVWDRGRREGRDLTAAQMFRSEQSQPVGFIFELTHFSLYRIMSQRARVAPMRVDSARRHRFEAPCGSHGAAAMPQEGRYPLALDRELAPDLAEDGWTEQPIMARRSRRALRAVAIDTPIAWGRDRPPAAHMQPSAGVG